MIAFPAILARVCLIYAPARSTDLEDRMSWPSLVNGACLLLVRDWHEPVDSQAFANHE